MKLLYLSLFFILIACNNNAEKVSIATVDSQSQKEKAKSKEDMDIMKQTEKEKVMYLIELNAVACNYEIRLNDFVLFEENEGASFAIEKRINEGIFNGANYLNIKVDKTETGFHPESKVEITIYREIKGDNNSRKEVFKTKVDDLVKEPSRVVKRELFPIADLPFEEPLWRKGETIDITDVTTLKKIFQKHKEIYDFFHDKNIEAILKEFELRQADLDKAYYLEEGDRINGLKASIQGTFDNANCVLLYFLPEKIEPILSCYGKTITLLFKEEKVPTTSYWDYGTSLTHTYRYHLCQNEEGEFYVCR